MRLRLKNNAMINIVTALVINDRASILLPPQIA